MRREGPARSVSEVARIASQGSIPEASSEGGSSESQGKIGEMMVYVVDRQMPSPPRPFVLAGLEQHRDSFERCWQRVIAQLGHNAAQVLSAEDGEPFRDLASRIAGTVRNP